MARKLVYHAAFPETYFEDNKFLCGKKHSMGDDWDFVHHFVLEGAGPVEGTFRVCPECRAAITPLVWLKYTEL